MMRSASQVMEALDEASRGVQAASTELSQLVTSFYEAGEGPEGEILSGVGLRFETKLKEELASIYQDAIAKGTRPPAEDIREALAYKAVETKHASLFAEYHSKKGRIDALRMWIANQKAAIGANQSLLRAERE